MPIDSSSVALICLGIIIGALGLWLVSTAWNRLQHSPRRQDAPRPAEHQVNQTIAPLHFESRRPPTVPNKYYLWMNLTAREKEIAHLVAQGKRNPEIAQELFISPYTVANHLRHIFGKLEINSRQQLTQVVRDIAEYDEDFT